MTPSDSCPGDVVPAEPKSARKRVERARAIDVDQLLLVPDEPAGGLNHERWPSLWLSVILR
jgi:ABC-type branched-subunit amino acid transport system ATPase component